MEKTKKHIIEKVAPIFNRKGFTGTYLSDLEKATGLTKGSIYGNFSNKSEVAVEAFKYNFKQLTSKIELEISKESNAGDKLIQFIHFYKTEYNNIVKNGGCPILNTATDADDGNKYLKTEVQNALKKWIKFIENILNDGILKNEIKEIDTNNFSIRMISIIEGSIMMAKVLDRKEIINSNISFLKNEIQKIKY